MSLTAEALECPNCGAAIGRQGEYCSYCQSPVFVRRKSDIDGKKSIEINKYVQFYRNYMQTMQGDSAQVRISLGLCLLEKGAYDEASGHFEKAINLMPETGDCFYYLALSKLRKKRPYMHTLPNIKQIVQYLETALEYEEVGRYYYLLYLIQEDFYDKKHLRNGKNSSRLRELAISCEVDDQDIAECKMYCNL